MWLGSFIKPWVWRASQGAQVPLKGGPDVRPQAVAALVRTMRGLVVRDGRTELIADAGPTVLPEAGIHCAFGHFWPKTCSTTAGSSMQTLSAKDAKYGFGRLDLACAELVAVAKHGRLVAVVMALEEFER